MKKCKLKQWYGKVKKWLEDNKIIFETVVMLSLTIMSISVAYNANKIADQANNLTEREMDIEHNEKLPHFTISNHNNFNESNILNVGGTISDATASYLYCVNIKASYEGKSETVVVRIIDAYEDLSVDYNYENRTFINKGYDLKIHSMMREIIDTMATVEITVEYQIIDIVELHYKDYLGEVHIERYSVEPTTKNYMKEFSNEDYYELMESYEFSIFGNNEKDEEAISNSSEELEEAILKKFI